MEEMKRWCITERHFKRRKTAPISQGTRGMVLLIRRGLSSVRGSERAREFERRSAKEGYCIQWTIFWTWSRPLIIEHFWSFDCRHGVAKSQPIINGCHCLYFLHGIRFLLILVRNENGLEKRHLGYCNLAYCSSKVYIESSYPSPGTQYCKCVTCEILGHFSENIGPTAQRTSFSR